MHGTNKEPLVIVDADAIVSFVDIGDENHNHAKQIMQQLAASQVYMLFPTTAICEAVTVLTRKLNKPDDAERIIKKFQSGNFPLQAVDQDILKEAATLFKPYGSKKNTLFDAVVATIAKRLNADAIFSFDGWYRKIGMTVTSDFIDSSKKAA